MKSSAKISEQKHQVVERPAFSEDMIKQKIVDFLGAKKDGNWHLEKSTVAGLHESGVDLKMVGGKRNSEYFLIECKGESRAKSSKQINKEGWIHALGQVVTRMNVSRYYKKKDGGLGINRAYKYGLGLYWVTAQVALRRIPKSAAQALNLYIFACCEDGRIIQFSPKDFGRDYPDERFRK